MNRLSSKLSAIGQIQAVESGIRSDTAADRADGAIVYWWKRSILPLLRLPDFFTSRKVRIAFGDLFTIARNAISAALHWVFGQEDTESRNSLVSVLPEDQMRILAAEKVGLIEPEIFRPPVKAPPVPQGGAILRQPPQVPSQPSREPPRKPPRRSLPSKPADDGPGAVEVALSTLDIKPTKAMQVLTHEPTMARMPKEEKKSLFSKLIFPPPSREVIDEIVYAPFAGMTWEQRLANATRTSATPEKIESTVAAGFAAGKTPQQIAKDLLPIVDGVRSTARRLARTESIRIAHGVQWRQWQGMGKMFAGAQVLATLDEHTRPWHASRSGDCFYFNPKPGQMGMDKCPHPPLESDGSIAWNCRCRLTALLEPLPGIVDSPAFKNLEGKLLPGPIIYARWFSRADDRRKRMAVGSRRYSLVKDAMGGDPPWEAFMSPETGNLMPMVALRNESTVARTERISKVKARIAEQERLTHSVSLYSFDTAI